jgi:ditrans,polycis-polyprenyl diphosphate synthase
MDGNRRYATKNKLKSSYEGHVLGIKSLKKCLLICGELGIKEISLFCFSIENFNRKQEEVNGLMKLCVETFQEMSSMSEILLK